MHSLPFLFLALLLQSCSNNPEQLLFSSTRDGQSNIYLMNRKGEQIQQLTNAPVKEWSPSWKGPSDITFLRQATPTIQIVQLNLETKIEKILPHPPNCQLEQDNLIYSKSGKRALYTCNRNIFLWELHSSTLINLTEKIVGTSKDPNWIDERNILFTNNATYYNDIYTLNLNTRKLVNLTQSNTNDEYGAISPNQHFLVYTSDRFEVGNPEIVLQNLSNQNIWNISRSPAQERAAHWGSNSNRIYYESNQDGDWDIYVQDIEGNASIRLTQNDIFDGELGVGSKK